MKQVSEDLYEAGQGRGSHRYKPPGICAGSLVTYVCPPFKCKNLYKVAARSPRPRSVRIYIRRIFNVTRKANKPIILKEPAKLLGLFPRAVSCIVNGHSSAFRIASDMQRRVLKAAASLGYTATTLAQNLRQLRTCSVGAIIPKISEGFSTAVSRRLGNELIVCT